MPPIDAIEHVHELLGLTYREIARGIWVDESTLHRWRSGVSEPSPVFRLRIAALADLLTALQRVSPSAAQARAWLDGPMPVLDGRTPRQVLMDGRPDLLTGVLLALRESASADLRIR